MSSTRYRQMLSAKIHGATVTDADVAYQGSVTVDADLLDLVDIVEHEQVDLLSLDSGERLTTYAIAGVRGSGDICVNGAAAHQIGRGEKVIILTYVSVAEEAVAAHAPRLLQLDADNQPRQGDILVGLESSFRG